MDAQRTFASYTNLVEIGRGGMATVYRATAPNGNLVALKILAIHLAADATARVRFRQESNLSLSHPNIVRVLDSGIDGDTPYIVMEYIAGESLDKWIMRAGRLTPRELAPILLDVARALDYAHGRNVIHRDVKPSNILIRANGRALLADFGIAKASGVTAYTVTTARVGSVFYMSPEQAIGTIELTPATDIYSLGVTAYYALTGRHPFEGDNEIAIARQHMDLPPRHVSDVNPAVPRAAGDGVMQALEKSPARRPASAGTFARGFVNALTTDASLPSPQIAFSSTVTGSTGPEQTTRVREVMQQRQPPSRSIWIASAALAVLVVAALAVVLALVMGSEESSQTAARATTPAGPSGPAIAIVTQPITSTQPPDSSATPPPQVLAPLITPTTQAGASGGVAVPPTPVPSPTSMPTPTRRPTRTLTPTWTPAPPLPPPSPTVIPTAPFFATPTNAPTPTETSVPPTATAMPTQTPITPAVSPTPIPTTPAPSDTPTPTPPPVSTPTIALTAIILSLK